MPSHLLANEICDTVAPAKNNSKHLSLQKFWSAGHMTIIWRLEWQIAKSRLGESKQIHHGCVLSFFWTSEDFLAKS
jgi:hypothetical protein